jgi:hypothetical protein
VFLNWSNSTGLKVTNSLRLKALQVEKEAETMGKIKVLGTDISHYQQKDDDYISLTDMVKMFGDETMIYSWMRRMSEYKVKN